MALTIVEIEMCAFAGCKRLTNVQLPRNLKKVPCAAFGKCPALTKVTLPDTTEIIDHMAFEYCPALKEINFPRSITQIGQDAFKNCSSLQGPVTLQLSKNVTIESNAFFTSKEYFYKNNFCI